MTRSPMSSLQGRSGSYKNFFRFMTLMIIALSLWSVFKLYRLRPLRHIDLIPIGQLNLEIVDAMAHMLTQKFNMSVERKDPIPLPNKYMDPQRQQFNADLFLRELQALPDKNFLFIFIIDQDIFVPSTDHVISSADYKNRSILASIYRLKGNTMDRDLTATRLYKSILRGLGFVAGLDLFAKCAMTPAHDVATLDQKSTDYCATDALLLSLTGVLRN